MVTDQEPDPRDDRPPRRRRDRRRGSAVAGSLGEYPLSVDDVFDVLSRPANRYVLTYVLVNDGAVAVDDLVEYVVERTDAPSGLTTGEYRGRVRTKLLHATLPKLEGTHLLAYDRDRGTVRETDHTHVVLPYIRCALHQQASRASLG